MGETINAEKIYIKDATVILPAGTYTIKCGEGTSITGNISLVGNVVEPTFTKE